VIHVGPRLDFSRENDLCVFAKDFAGNLAVGILREVGVEDGVSD
jgi:hypothetical protein